MSEIVDVLVEKKTFKKSDVLKIIAIITMLIDHTGLLLFPDDRIFRTIGRIAFPIFAYLLVQGFIYTSNRFKYGFRFLCFALIAELPYSFLNNDVVRETEHWNVMYLLLVGLILLIVVEKAGLLFKDKQFLLVILLSIVAFTIVAFPDVVSYYNQDFALSYGTYGLVMILLFYWFRKRPIILIITYIMLSFIEPYRMGVYYRALYFSKEMGYWEAFVSYDLIYEQITTFKDGLTTLEGYFFQARSMMGLVCILIFSRLKIPVRLPKYVGYFFYPVHITLLLLIRLYLGGPIG